MNDLGAGLRLGLDRSTYKENLNIKVFLETGVIGMIRLHDLCWAMSIETIRITHTDNAVKGTFLSQYAYPMEFT